MLGNGALQYFCFLQAPACEYNTEVEMRTSSCAFRFYGTLPTSQECQSGSDTPPPSRCSPIKACRTLPRQAFLASFVELVFPVALAIRSG